MPVRLIHGSELSVAPVVYQLNRSVSALSSVCSVGAYSNGIEDFFLVAFLCWFPYGHGIGEGRILIPGGSGLSGLGI